MVGKAFGQQSFTLFENFKNFGNAVSIAMILCLAILGFVVGSMLDCFAWRLCYGENPVTGRYRDCGEAIPAHCLATGMAGAVLFVGLGLHVTRSLELVMWLVLGCILLLLSLIDWNIQLLPDKLLLLAVANRLLFLLVLHQPLGSTVAQMLLGACSVSVPLLLLVLLMDKLLGKETMGGGDIKLLFVLGLYLSWLQMLLLLFVGCVLALLASAWLQRRGQGIPFGPFLALAWFLVILVSDPLVSWYLLLF